jgi:hypothetical protein
MAHIDDIRNFAQGGMDSDSAPEFVLPNDFRSAFNVRNSGTSKGEAGYITNIESTELVTEIGSAPTGINKGIGGKEFENIKKVIAFRYNAFGHHQILIYDYQADTLKAIYTDLVDSAGIALMPLDPKFYVNYILLVNDQYAVWTDGNITIGFTDIDKLASGAYGTITAEDFSLIKPQALPPITGVYASDAGKASNFCKNKLFQFNTMWFGQDFTSSAWSTWSKRIIPAEEATPTVGTDVTVNNCIVLNVPVGSNRVQTINVGARYGDFGYSIIKSVDRAYVVALPHTAVDISTEVFEAYNPATGLYSFVFYNDSVAIPVAPTDTDLAYDRVPLKAGVAELINTNIIALADCTEGYVRPDTAVTIKAVGYNPNLTIPSGGGETNPLRVTYEFPGDSGSGAGNHVRIMIIAYGGVPHTGDEIIVEMADIRDASNTQTITYTVPSGEDGNLGAVVGSLSLQLQASNVYDNGDGTIRVEFRGDPYFGLFNAAVVLFHAGATVSKSIHAVLDNSSYQLALSYRDAYGRYFPLDTNNNFIVKTPSFAQLSGQAVGISWTINNPAAPASAVDYQWLITKNNTTSSALDVLGAIISYQGIWNAHTNSPLLAPNSAFAVGDTFQVGTPNLPTDTPLNLGNGTVQYNTGDYVVNNGKSWDVVSKEFADMTSTSNIMVIKINPLNIFNTEYTNSGLNTILNYDFSENDRCTIHAYYTGATPTYLNSPCIDLGVVGYDPTTFLVKVTKSPSLNPTTIAGKNIYIRLYSPKQQTAADTSTTNETVWYEIGERFTITNGLHNTLTGNITDGDVYFKTRQYQGAIDPDVPYPLLATDFNFSDYYDSAFTSYGRPRAYNDELEATERKAITRYSQNFILGSRNNGLTRFFAEAIYGEADGQTSSSYGAIQVLWQRGDILVVVQENNTGYVPINLSILEDAAQQKQYAISEKLFNNIRYNQTGNIGCGTAKESFCFYDNMGWFIDPLKSVPIQIGLDGITDISYKMNKFFKQTIQESYAAGLKLVMYYDRYYKELIFATQTEGGVLSIIPFNALNWNILDDYTIAPADITANNGVHSTVSYNSTTGIATYTPATNYVGSDVATFSFPTGVGTVTKNVCLNWTAGVTGINPFYFVALVNQPLSTLLSSNTVSISGNTVPVPISITGGQYSINMGSWTSVSGSVNAGDVVQVRQTSSASYNTTTTTTLTVSGYSADFNVSTTTTAPGLEVQALITDAGEQLTITLAMAIDCVLNFTITWTANKAVGGTATRTQNLSIAAGDTTITTDTGHGGDTINCVNPMYSIYLSSCGMTGSVLVYFVINVDLTYCSLPPS